MSKREVFWLVENDEIKKSLWRLGLSAAIANGKAQAPSFREEQQVAILRLSDHVGDAFVEHAARMAHSSGYEGPLVAVPIDSTEELTKDALRAAWRQRTTVLPDPEQFVEMMKAGPKPKSLSAAELLSMPIEEIDWLVGGLLPVGGMLLLSAKPKAGKSVLARTLGLCVARGVPFLGRDVRQGTVLWLCLDEDKGTFVPAMRALGLVGTDAVRFYLREDEELSPVAWLEQEMEVVKPACVVIDTLQDLVNVENLNDYAQVKRATSVLKRMRDKHGCAQVCIHHNNKGDPKKKDTGRMDAALGSVAITSAASAFLSISVTDDDLRCAWSRGRSVEPFQGLVLSMNEQTGWVTGGGSQYEAEVRIAEPKVIQALGNGAWATTAEIVEAVECRRQVALGALRELVKAGTVAVSKDGRAKTYCLPHAQDSASGTAWNQSDTGNGGNLGTEDDLLAYSEEIII